MRLHEIRIPEKYKYLATDHRLHLTQELFDLFKFVEQIKRDCQPYLKQINYEPFNSLPLYRGITDDAATLTKSVRLKNRGPSDTPLDVHQMIQGYFKRKFGEAFRSSLFCTGSPGIASNYGNNVYRIFPIGNFTFLWSPKIEDLYSISGEYSLGVDVNPGDPDWEAVTQQFKDEVLSTYQTTDLINATRSNHEVMIRAAKYHAVRDDYISYNKAKAFTELLKQ